MTQKELEREIIMIKKSVETLENLLAEVAENNNKLNIIVTGSKDFDVPGLASRQKADEEFRTMWMQEFVHLRDNLDTKIEESTKSIRVDLQQLKDLKNLWTKIFELMTTSRFWKVVGIIIAAGLSLFALVKSELIKLIK